jgi:hypothetical protein
MINRIEMPLSQDETLIVRIKTLYLYVYLRVMDRKLTIKLNEQVISKAKKYAKMKNTSLSRLIESYLDALTGKEENESEITPLVKSLSGVITLPPDFDYKTERTGYLQKKHS